MGDLQFIRDRVKAGEWLETSGAIDAITNKISIVPASGKTLFMYRGKIIPTGHSSPPAMGLLNTNTIVDNRVEAQFKVDGVQKDTANCGYVMNVTASANTQVGGGGAGIGDQKESRFDVTGLSLVGDGIKEVAIENVLDNGTADANMSGWIETT